MPRTRFLIAFSTYINKPKAYFTVFIWDTYWMFRSNAKLTFPVNMLVAANLRLCIQLLKCKSQSCHWISWSPQQVLRLKCRMCANRLTLTSHCLMASASWSFFMKGFWPPCLKTSFEIDWSIKVRLILSLDMRPPSSASTSRTELRGRLRSWSQPDLDHITRCEDKDRSPNNCNKRSNLWNWF